jgi:DUF1680 family protein
MLATGVAIVLGAAFLATPVTAQVSPPAVADGHVLASPFDISQVTLGTGRWFDNQERTLTYLKFVDINRLLYVFRDNHKLSTNGATANGGWDATTFPFRSHVQGHFLSAWAQCYATLKDATCKSQATAMTAAMVACQNNNAAAGFKPGYLSGFPESDFTALEQGTLTNGNVPYYVIHKILAGLVDVWKNIGDANAKTAALALAAWVDTRTAALSTVTMQNLLNTEFGGMMEVLVDIYFQSGDTRWLTTAMRFYHVAVLNPLVVGTDNLDGLHGNTQVPKWIGAARDYKATGNATMLSIAKNAWSITTKAHAYAMGGITEAEHFHAANAISTFLDTDTAEHCDTYNMMKLTRELFTIDPSSTAYFDFYERALMNHIVGAQLPSDSHGQITYFSSLNPGSLRGLGPAWGGGTWSTDYNSFWCCQGTGLEVNTKHMDSIYFFDSNNIFVNLFHSSTVTWSAKGVSIQQTTTFPITTFSTITITGSGTFGIKIRIPSWTNAAGVTVNGNLVSGVTTGSYLTISRTWASGDTVVVNLPMSFKTIVANDNSGIAAVTYGPVIIAASNSATTMPTLALNTLARTSTTSLTFSGSVNGAATSFVAYYEAQTINAQYYFKISGAVPSPPTSVSIAGSSSTQTASAGGCAALFGQCGGSSWTGPLCCVSGSTCTFSNDFYSQCLAA